MTRRSARPTRRPRRAGHAHRDGRPRPGRLNWGAATDNVGVARYNVHRATTAGFTPSAGEPDRPADRDDLRRHGAHAGHVLLPGHRRGRRRERRPASNEASATATADTTPRRRRPRSPRRRRRAGLARLERRDRRRRGRPLQRSPLHDVRLHARASANRIAQPTGTSYTDRARRRHLLLPRHRRRRGRERGAPSPPGDRDGRRRAAPGLVAAYGFDAGSGTTAAGQLRNGNIGTLSGPTWATGPGGSATRSRSTASNARVTVADSNTLDLTTG